MSEEEGISYFNREDYRHALEIFLENLEEAVNSGDRARIAYNANLAGMCLHFLHNHNEALKYFEMALSNTEGIDNDKVQTNIDEVKRFVERMNRDLEELNERIEAEEDKEKKGILLSNRGLVQYLLGNNELAEQDFRMAERIFRDLNEPIALGAIFSNYALLYDDMRKLDYTYLALDIFVQEGHIKGQVDAYHTLALYYLHQNELNEALYFLKKEMELADDIEDVELKRRMYELAADISMDLGNMEDAMKYTEQASKV